MRYEIGTLVNVYTRRKNRTMVVAGYRTVHRKGRTRDLAYRVTGDANSLDREVVCLADCDEMLWVEMSPTARAIKPTGKTMSAAAARKRMQEVKDAIADSRYEHADQNLNAADDNGLLSLRNGASIEVKFSDIGWTRVEFAGFVKSSGNVRFRHRGRTRTTSPANARPVTA